MGSTINGVYTGKRGRRERALRRLEDNLENLEDEMLSEIKALNDPFQRAFAPNISANDIEEKYIKREERILKEIEILKSRI